MNTIRFNFEFKVLKRCYLIILLGAERKLETVIDCAWDIPDRKDLFVKIDPFLRVFVPSRVSDIYQHVDLIEFCVMVKDFFD